jgi:MoxR-like ATPase
MRGMQAGEIVRLEEITRATTAIQDGLISPFSERFIAVPELDMIVEALQGFNCILTANYADKGTQELSAALERRVCMKRLPSLPSLEAEIAVVARRSQELLDENPDYADIRIERNPVAIAAQVVRELREKAARVNGAVVPLSRPDSTLSPAETIDAAYQGALLGAFFGNGQMTVADIAPAVRDVVVKGSDENAKAFNDYVSRVAQQRARANPLWKEFAEAIA